MNFLTERLNAHNTICTLTTHKLKALGNVQKVVDARLRKKFEVLGAA